MSFAYLNTCRLFGTEGRSVHYLFREIRDAKLHSGNFVLL